MPAACQVCMQSRSTSHVVGKYRPRRKTFPTPAKANTTWTLFCHGVQHRARFVPGKTWFGGFTAALLRGTPLCSVLPIRAPRRSAPTRFPSKDTDARREERAEFGMSSRISSLIQERGTDAISSEAFGSSIVTIVLSRPDTVVTCTLRHICNLETD